MDGNMRRLPPWMLTGASADVPARSNRTDNKRVVVKRKHEREEAPKEKRIVKAKERDESEEPKKVEIKTRGGEEEVKPSRIDVGKNPEIIQSVTGPEEEEEDLTVDDLLSFAQEYVKGDEDKTLKDGEGLSISESNTNTRAEDMLSLLLGPYFKKPPPL